MKENIFSNKNFNFFLKDFNKMKENIFSNNNFKSFKLKERQRTWLMKDIRIKKVKNEKTREQQERQSTWRGRNNKSTPPKMNYYEFLALKTAILKNVEEHIRLLQITSSDKGSLKKYDYKA